MFLNNLFGRLMAPNSMGYSWALTVTRYGNQFRKLRGLLHRFLQISAVEEYRAVQTRETHRMVESLMRTPDNVGHQVRRYVKLILYTNRTSAS